MGLPKGIERFGRLDEREFAGRIRAARAYADLTLEQAGAMLGISRQALSRRENQAVAISTPERFVMATVYSEATGWPVTFFTEEKMPDLPIPQPEGAELEPEEIEAGLAGARPSVTGHP